MISVIFRPLHGSYQFGAHKHDTESCPIQCAFRLRVLMSDMLFSCDMKIFMGIAEHKKTLTQTALSIEKNCQIAKKKCCCIDLTTLMLDNYFKLRYNMFL